MKKIVLSLMLAGALSLFTPAFAVPPDGPHGGMNPAMHHIHAGPPPIRPHRRAHGAVMFNMSPRHSYWHNGNYYYGNVSTVGFNNYYCPCYGVCRPFRHPGPQYSSGFYISF